MPKFPPIAYHLFDIPASNLIFPVRMCNLCLCMWWCVPVLLLLQLR